MADRSPEWKPRNRPVSTIALNFSDTLDDLFNLGTTGEMAIHVEQKKTELKSREQQLQALDAQLRQADERLKRLQSKHKRMQSENMLTSLPHAHIRRGQQSNSSDSEGAFSDGHSSPTSDAVGRR